MTSENPTSRTALILGATGGIGGAVARALLQRGWTIKALSRNAAAARRKLPQANWIQGDALDAEAVKAAAAGADLIVHAVNPPGYRDWETQVMPMLENTIAAAYDSGARILLPGTIYNFGPDAFPDLREDSPQNPQTRKGAIRVQMERRLKAASANGVSVIILRAGDFFGPGAANNWFSQGLVKPGKPVTSVIYPGRAGVGHQWAYLPDAAETMVRLVERAASLPAFAVYHMQGFWDRDGTELIAAIGRVAGRQPKIRHFPWWLLPFAAPFVPFMRELREMRYLWEQPLRMDNARLVAAIGEEPRTAIDEAIAATLGSLGCLPQTIASGRAADRGLQAFV
ncbi:NAD-dependent epimerase/dehydratase family protein [Rhizobium sp. LjRoot30]|uniref:NAD-dependent epimerase/dehydratase family protein n=1 Tax=Rhizobium sp. LjRoot30 TaxID=3342320 RepID=UPI003ED138B3